MNLRCSVCFFLLKPLDLEDDAELIIKDGYSLCEDHAHIGSDAGYHQAIAEANREATDSNVDGTSDDKASSEGA